MGKERGETPRDALLGNTLHSARRAQVTVFFAIGAVLLISIAIYFVAMPGKRSDGGAAQNAKDLSQNAVLNQYLTSCLDTIMNDELDKLGASGGLPDDVAAHPNAVVGTGARARKVLFGITRNRDCASAASCAIYPMAYPAPQYPDYGVALGNSTKNTMTCDALGCADFFPFMDGYFGDVNFPATCDPVGPNAPGGAHACTYYYHVSGSTRIINPPGTAGPSTQEQLLRHVSQRVETCADIGVFSRATGANVESVSAPTVNITFTPESIIVLFTYPITLKGGVETTTLPIDRRYDVRYLSIATFAFDLAREETRNATFNITNPDQYSRLPSYRAGFRVGKSRNVSLTGSTLPATPAYGADMVTIIDESSRVDNTAYTFSFLVEHRPPMLTQLTDLSACTQANVAAIAVDPDENPIIVKKEVVGSDTNCSISDPDMERDWQLLPTPI